MGAGTSWDFSDSAEVGFYEGDLVYDVSALSSAFRNPSDYYWGTNGSAKIAFSDSTYETLDEAPDDPALYFYVLPMLPNQCYVIRTNEGHYAKFRDIPGPPGFDYTYQDDGSRVLDPGVAVEETTWGRIKAMYRGEVP